MFLFISLSFAFFARLRRDEFFDAVAHHGHGSGSGKMMKKQEDDGTEFTGKFP